MLLSLTSLYPHGAFQSLLGLKPLSESMTQSCLIVSLSRNAAEINEMNYYYYPELTGIQMLNDAPK